MKANMLNCGCHCSLKTPHNFYLVLLCVCFTFLSLSLEVNKKRPLNIRRQMLSTITDSIKMSEPSIFNGLDLVSSSHPHLEGCSLYLLVLI